MADQYQVVRPQAPEQVLWSDIQLAANPWRRLKGLLGRKGLTSEQGVWFKPCNSIHSVGMQFDFDAVYLDRQGHIVALQERIPPGKLLPIVWKASQVLEIPAGAIAEKSLVVGQQLQLQRP